MYQIYTTKAIIIKSLPRGEANKIYFLLTHDLGFIMATAQGVRLGKSKLKGHLQDFAMVNITLVKGKEFWRIVSVESVEQKSFLKNLEKVSMMKNIFSLLLRLLHGEEKNEELFDCIDTAYTFLSAENLSSENMKNLETILVLRILYSLGYFKKSPELSPFTENETLSLELLHTFTDKRKMAIGQINAALLETNL